MKRVFGFLSLMGYCLLSAQSDLPVTMDENLYASPKNEFYWKARKPDGSYWQQDVHYQIRASLDPSQDMITGFETLTYTNNSPDTLKVLYFHLYQNAFTPNSYVDQLAKDRNQKKIDFGRNGNAGKGTQVGNVYTNGDKLDYEMDNTVMKVYLKTAILPNQKIKLDIDFATYFSEGDADSRRMKIIREKVNGANGVYEVKHYDVVHWYPRIAVYDRRFRWETAQHMGHEFYGDFGSFDVQFTLPGNYIADATGVLQNTAVLSDAEWAAIDLKNFADKDSKDIATEVISPDAPARTWIFHALNVHDFALTTDPTYRRGVVEKEGIQFVALARERKAAQWQDAAEFASNVINVYNQDFGRYLYPKMIVADADDGMEYPMLTLDGGKSPGYYSLFAHEIAHNWFFGMVGSNETYRAFLDEGFTQFLQLWSMEKLVGPKDPGLPKFLKLDGKEIEGYYQYIIAARAGSDGVLNTHSDEFGHPHNSPGYGHVYDKTATMLYNLKYVLGEEKFLGAMQFYFNRWKLAHPYPEDFRLAVADYTQTDLNWFFDQWLNTDKQIDYAVKDISKVKGGKTSVTLSRKGSMIMPLEVVMKTNTGTLKYQIPVSNYDKKDSSFTTLPKWTGWGDLNQDYTIIVPAKRVSKVVIDPNYNLADVNLLNNKSCTPVRFRPRLFPDFIRENLGDWKHYTLNVTPHIWWNGYSGLQIGGQLRGSYMGDAKTKLAVWYNSGIGATDSPSDALRPFKNDYHKIGWRYSYQTTLRSISPKLKMNVNSQFRDGLQKHGFGFSYQIGGADISSMIAGGGSVNSSKVYFSYQILYRKDSAYRDYLLYPNQWTVGKTNAFATVGYEKTYKAGARAVGKLKAELRSSTLGSQSQYANLNLESRYSKSAGKFNLRYRLFGRYGVGQTPLESALYLAGGSPEEMYEDAFARARGFVPTSLLDNNFGQNANKFQFGGGLGLRGYTGYEAQFEDAGAAWYGNSGAAINLEFAWRGMTLDASPVGEFLGIRPYLFYDAGVIGRSKNSSFASGTEWSKFRQDAGAGIALEIGNEKFFRPFVLRADFPVFLSRPPFGQEVLAFRWQLGLGKAF